HPLYFHVDGSRPQLRDPGGCKDETPNAFVREEVPKGSDNWKRCGVQGLNQTAAVVNVALYQCCLIHRMNPSVASRCGSFPSEDLGGRQADPSPHYSRSTPPPPK